MKNLKLITESSSNYRIKKDGQKLFLSGLFQQAERKNSNGRVYTKSLLAEQVEELQPKIERKALFGQLGHPDNPSGNPSKISHRIDELRWSGNDLMGRALVLNTDMGKNLRAIIEAGSQIMISSRAVGSYDRETGMVESDGFSLISFDIVESGGVADAYVQGVYENRTWSPCEVSSLLEQNHYKDRVFECFCPYCEAYTTHRNKRCSEVKCDQCQMKLKHHKIYDGQEIFQSQIQEWTQKIKEREGGI